MVHLEQARQPFRVLLTLLEIIDQPDLPLHERLAAAGQVHEHRVDVPPQRGLVRRQPQRLLVHLVERPRHLTDLVRGIHVDRHHIQRDALTVGLGHPADHLRQPQPGHLEGTSPQLAQRPHHGPADHYREQDREHEDEQHDAGDLHRCP